MDAALDDELRALRARAYGPDADIADDPAAEQRLHELEGLRRNSLIPADPPAPATRRQRRADDSAPASASGDRAPAGSPAIIDAAQVPRALEADDGRDAELAVALGFDVESEVREARARVPRRLVALWVGSVAAAAAITAVLTYAAVSIVPVPTTSGAVQVDTLTPSTSPALQPETIGGTEDSPVWEFHGVILYRGESGAPTNESEISECLWLFVPAPDSADSDASVGGLSGWGSTGCSAGAFPATVTAPLRDDLPDELLAAFPDGKALQFVLDGDRIGVFLDSDGAPADADEG